MEEGKTPGGTTYAPQATVSKRTLSLRQRQEVQTGLLQSKESYECLIVCRGACSSGEPQMSDDMFLTPGPLRGPFHGPVDRGAECLGQDRPTGFADGRQLAVRPFIRMALPQLAHQEAV